MKMDLFTKHCAAAIIFAATVSLQSCNDQDFDFDKMHSQNVEANYVLNFAQIYGAVDPNQNWDFSRGTIYGGTRAETVNYTYTTTDYKEVDQNLVSQMKRVLGEGDNHKSLGKAFAMAVPDCPFTIYPIYQGVCMTWDLHIVVYNPETKDYEDIKFWKKGQDIQKKTSSNNNWVNVGSNTNNNDSRNASNTTNATAIRSKGYKFSNLPLGATMYLYIELTAVDSPWGTVGQKHTSTGDMMRALYPADGIDIPKEYQDAKVETMIIGVEDSNNTTVGSYWQHTDWDYNDLVLLVVGDPYVPQPIEIKEGYYEKTITSTKRYMVEDMGYSDPSSIAVTAGYTDIDFNDIVVDFKNVKTEYHETKKDQYGNITSDIIKPEKATSKTTAKVRALGGTWDFKLYVGDSEVFHKHNASQIGKTNGVIIDSQRGSSKVDFNTNYKISNVAINGLDAGKMYNTGNMYSRNDGNYNTVEKTENDDSWICELTATGLQNWDPITNNIKFVIQDVADFEVGEHFYDSFDSSTDPNNVYFKAGSTLNFPKMGETPKIVAFDPTKTWQRERVHVTTEWFKN